MRKYLVPAVAALTILAPLKMAVAQSGTSTAPRTEHMQGSPNASGYGKGEGIDKKSRMEGASGAERNGKEDSSATNMKGPPNANGYSK